MVARKFPPGFGFGVEVLIQAEAVRLVNELVDGQLTFNTLIRSRGHTGKVPERRFVAEDWPGAPVDADWAPTPRAYPLAPNPRDFDRPAVRVRRILNARPRPPRGIVIGSTDRQEHYIVDSKPERPFRRIHLLEVALHVPSGAAQIVLVHPNDLQRVPRPRRRP